MWCVSASPQCFHVLPPSAERYTPLPQLTEFRGFPSPVPTYTTSGFPWHTATAPMHCVGWSSKTEVKVVPPSVVFHTPPPAVAT